MLADAIKAEAGAAPADPETLFTDDVVGWSPYVTVSGLEAVAALAALREEAFSNVVITFRRLDEVGNKAFAEWLIEAAACSEGTPHHRACRQEAGSCKQEDRLIAAAWHRRAWDCPFDAR